MSSSSARTWAPAARPPRRSSACTTRSFPFVVAVSSRAMGRARSAASDPSVAQMIVLNMTTLLSGCFLLTASSLRPLLGRAIGEGPIPITAFYGVRLPGLERGFKQRLRETHSCIHDDAPAGGSDYRVQVELGKLRKIFSQLSDSKEEVLDSVEVR